MTPPAGKALVNFHRPDNKAYLQFTFPIFDATGRFLADLPVNSRFQYTCDPGEHVFIGWLGNNPVSVIKADLAADRVYDIYVLEGASVRPKLFPIPKQDKIRSRLTEWESSAELVALKRLPRVTNSEAKVQSKIAKIREDFLGGPKSDRVGTLQKEDCR